MLNLSILDWPFSLANYNVLHYVYCRLSLVSFIGWINDALYCPCFAVFGEYTVPTCENGKRAKSHICGNFEIVRGWRGGEFERKEDHPRDTIQLTLTPFLFKYRRCLMGRQNLWSASKDVVDHHFFSFMYVLSLYWASNKTTYRIGGKKVT